MLERGSWDRRPASRGVEEEYISRMIIAMLSLSSLGPAMLKAQSSLRSWNYIPAAFSVTNTRNAFELLTDSIKQIHLDRSNTRLHSNL